VILAGLAMLLALATIDEPGAPLGPADLVAYRAALRADSTDGAPTPVGFRQLWDRPEEFRGRVVTVEGQLRRRFRQPAIGEFPALVESWLVTEAGDSLCAVAPATDGSAGPALGTRVRFTGTYLKRLRYPGGDVERLAPLVVGPAPPTVLPRRAVPIRPAFGSISNGALIAAVGLLVAWTIVRARWIRPGRRPRRADPEPQFLEPGEVGDRPAGLPESWGAEGREG